jgi:hypothetical protein
MIKLTAFFVTIYFAVIGCNNSSRIINKDPMDKLQLIIKAEKNRLTTKDDIVVKAALVNQSSETLLVNDRFLIGYEERDDREIYFRIFSSNGKRHDLPEDHQADIFSLAITASNMKELIPGKSIENRINLTPMYEFSEPGKYKVVAIYESKPFENTKGVYQMPVCSDTLEIEIVK